MPEVEIKGNQIRIRVHDPKKFSTFRTQDVGARGRLQRIAGKKKSGGWTTQAWRLNLNDYSSLSDIIHDIERISDVYYYSGKGIITQKWGTNIDSRKQQAKKLALAWWRKNKGETI